MGKLVNVLKCLGREIWALFFKSIIKFHQYIVLKHNINQTHGCNMKILVLSEFNKSFITNGDQSWYV